MKLKNNRMFRSAAALILAAVMLVSQFSTVFAATLAEEFEGKQTINYVSFGGSNVNGYGLRGYLPDGITPSNYAQVNIYGYKRDVEYSYPDLISDYLEENGYEVEVDQLAMSSMRVEEVRVLLDNSYPGDKYTDWRFYDVPGYNERTSQNWFYGAGKIALEELGRSSDGATFEEAFAALREVYQKDVKEADLITLDVGINNFGVYLSNQLVSNMYENDLAVVDPELEDEYEKAKAYIIELLKNDYPEYADLVINYEDMIDTLAYALLGFCVNFDKVVEKIYELNPDVKVVTVSIQNLMKDLQITIPGSDTVIPLGDMFGAIINAANIYAATLSPYATKYVYADVRKDQRVEFFVDDIIEYNGDPSYLSDNMKDCFDIYDLDLAVGTRIGAILFVPIFEQNQELLGKLAYTYETQEQIDLIMLFLNDAAKDFEVMAKKGFFNEQEIAYIRDLYQNQYLPVLSVAHDVVAEIMQEGAKLVTLDMGSLTQRFGPVEDKMIDGIFNTALAAIEEFKKNPEFNFDLKEAYPDGFFKTIALQNNFDEAFVYTVASLGVRTSIGNSFFGHPNPDGHAEIFEAILSAVAENKMGYEVVEEELIHPILDELKEYYLENSSEINDQIYEYLLNNPEEVLKLIEENQGNKERQMAAIAVAAYIFNYYGGQEAVEKMLADPEGTFNMLVDLMLTHGDNAYRLLKTYIDASGILEDITCEDVENVLEKLAELVKKYGPGIAQGIYDWAESQGYIDQIEDAVKEVTDQIDEKIKSFIDDVQPKVEKAIEDVENLVAEKKAELADLKAKIENEIIPEIEKLKADLKEKKAAYDVVMAHLDEYHPEEKAQVIAALEAEIKELEQQIVENEAIKAQIDEAIATITTEINDVETVMAQMQAKIEETAEEVEKLIKVSEDLVKAAEALVKASVENIDEELIEAELTAIIAELEEAVNEVVHHIKYAMTITEMVTGIAGTTEKTANSLIEKAEGYYASVKPQVEAVIAELEKLVDGSKPEAETIINNIISDVKEIGGISEELAVEIADVAKVIVEESAELVSVITEEVEKSINYLEKTIETAYANAITGDYVYTKDAYYVSIGDSITTGANNYSKKLAAELGLNANQFAELGNGALRAEDIRYILDENYTPDAYGKDTVKNVEALRKQFTSEIEKADIITVGVGNFTPFVFTQIGKDVFGDAYEMDWAKLVGEDHVQYIDMALEEVRAYVSTLEMPEIPYKNLIDRFIDINVEELVMTAVESYAYAYAGFSFNYAELVNAIHEINPDAEVVVVGTYNTFDGLVVGDMNLGEYVDYLIELMDVQFTAYAMLTPNTTFVEVHDTEIERPLTDVTGMVLSIVASELPSWISSLIGAKEAAINPSENGHEYIKTQILDALNITYDGLLGDVNLDGKVNALDATQILRYCNMKTSVFTQAKGHKLALLEYLADVDYEEGINALDATQILRYCNMKPSTLDR